MNRNRNRHVREDRCEAVKRIKRKLNRTTEEDVSDTESVDDQSIETTPSVGDRSPSSIDAPKLDREQQLNTSSDEDT